MIDIEKMYELRNELKKNRVIKQVYYAEDNSKNLSSIEIYRNFGYLDFNEVYHSLIKNLEYLIVYAINDNSSSKNVSLINNLIFDLNNGIGTELDIDKSFLARDENILLLIELQNMLVLYAVTSIEEKDISEFLFFKDNGDFVLQRDTARRFYRGESDFAYKLLPSIYRNYDVKHYGSVFNINVMFELYRDTNLLEKYSKIFDYEYVDYDFCAYMQHSKSYSPLLDLTSEPCVALSFATKSYGDLNKYMNCNASLYEFQFNDYKHLDVNDAMIFGKHKTYIVSSRLKIDSKVYDKLLCKCTFKDFGIDVSIFNEKVNDRMKYQKGSFLYINNSVIVNGIMLMPLSKGKIIKYKISPPIKTKIYNAIKHFKQHYDYEHLMDPYMFFGDAPNT